MRSPLLSPFLVLPLSFVLLWLSARLGAALRKRQPLDDGMRHDLDVVVAATLTLLGLIIGFSFSMATELLSAVTAPAEAPKPTPVLALVVSGMNDVLNTQGYTQAAWWNRIPTAAWVMMMLIAISANVMFGYGARRANAGVIHVVILPLVLSIALFLIADIDSPRRGVIRVNPQNLTSLAQSLQAH